MLKTWILGRFTGDALTVGAIGEGATRETPEAIEAYISDRVPASE